MTTACTRGSQIRWLVMTILTIPLLVGQGCPTTTTSNQLTVNAGADKTVQTSLSVVLQASVTGGSGIYSYAWAPTTGLSSSTVLQPTFTASTVGTTTYTLTVTDNLGTSVSDSAVVTVVAQTGGDTGNTDTGSASTLAANAGPDKTTVVGTAVTLEGAATGGTAPYSYQWSPTTSVSNVAVAQPTFTPAVSGTLTLKLTVTDALGNIATDLTNITVLPSATLSSLMWGANFSSGGYEVVTTFSRDLGKSSAENVNNYKINGSTDHPTSASLGSDKRTVTLVFNQRLTSLTRLDLGVGDSLRDALGGVVAAATNQAIGANPADDDSPTTVTRTWGLGQDTYTVNIQFSEAMDRASTEAINNYILGGVPPTGATLDSSGMVVTLTFASTIAGLRRTDTLQISSDVRDINRNATTSTNPAAMAANSADLTGPSAPAASRSWQVNQTSYKVDVTFNEVLDKTSAENINNYLLNGNLPTAAALAGNGRKVTLTFAATITGLAKTDTLSITANVLDINGRSNVSTAATAVTANPVDAAGPSLSNEQGRTWDKNGAIYTVILRFSEVMDRTSATTPANYTLAGDGGLDTRNPATAVLDTTGRIVTLAFPATAAGLSRNDKLTLLADVQDINGRALTSTQAALISSAVDDTTSPTATSRKWKANDTTYEVEITFSEVMDKLSATNVNNYRIHGNGGLDVQRPTAVVLDSTGKILTLTFATSVAGFTRLDAVEIMSGVSDINGRTTASITTLNAIPSANTADAIAPSVVRATKINATTVDIVFSEVLDKTSVEAATYLSAGGLSIDVVSLLGDGLTVRLTVSGGDPLADTITTAATIRDVNNIAAAQTAQVVADVLIVNAGVDLARTIGVDAVLAPVVTGGVGPYTYSWTPTANLVGANTSAPSFTPTKLGSFNFTVVVTDSEGRTASDVVSVVVSPS